MPERVSNVRILVVDDEESIVDVVSTALLASGFDVVSASTGHQALDVIRQGGIDLVVLDVMLNATTGFAVMERWQAEGHSVPTLFLTARSDETDVTYGLSLGADDYVRKPFGVDELLARVRAVLRRTAGPGKSGEAEVLRFADLRLDRRNYTVHRGARQVDLTPNEFRLVEFMLDNTGRILTRTQLVEHLWPNQWDAFEATLETVISRLRRKLNNGSEPDLIVTRRGVGYGLVASGSAGPK